MSHRFKPQKRVTVYRPKRTDRAERELRMISSMLKTPSDFQNFLLQVEPDKRGAITERLRPYLPFKMVLENTPGQE